MVNYLVESIIFAGKKNTNSEIQLVFVTVDVIIIITEFCFRGDRYQDDSTSAICHFFLIYLFSQGVFLVFWIRTTFSTHEYSLQIFAAASAVIKRRSSLGRSTSGSERHTEKSTCVLAVPTCSQPSP